MTDKRIKNEQWSVKELISKIDNKEITKPKFQRKKKWDTHPKKKNSSPNDYAYIRFLFDTENSVHAITFGQETNSQRLFYSNIDGNNRINAIKHFMDRPFEIFNEYLDDLFKIFDKINSENIIKIKDIFKSLSYEQIIKMKTPSKFFRTENIRDLFEEIRVEEDSIEQEVEQIQKHLMINGKDYFDSAVKINVNLFEGYNTDELCKTFEDINKYNSKLTETELLACRLHNICNFTINNKPFKTELHECIEEYYKDKTKKEVLVCYEFKKENINAHDFIVGFQHLCNKKYKFIGKTEVDGLSLFFKLWNVLNKSFIDTFTTENVNDFIEKINYSCNILQETISNIFTDKISNKLFNNSCQTKLKTLKKNHWFMLICCIIGYKNTKETKCIIIKNLEKALIYHFFICDLKNEDIRRVLKMDDPLLYKSGVSWVDSTTKIYLEKPNTISNKLNKELFEKLISALYNETNSPHERKLENGKNKNDKRRTIKFFEKTIMFYYYKGKIPTNMLDNEFSIEHIIPNSSEWEGELDKDRTGNLIPIISTINSQRGNKHINSYKKKTEGTTFCEFIKDIIPNDDVYNTIINHDNKTPKIINTEKYNEMCEKNEHIYLQNFVDCLFR
jgi:hypothetical protein